ncbi:YheC/YheD family protein [Cohnella caldifontis]|uniref:YheC/YheD family protein n=1 Tax=Cohnella caldifontis TaxID=3027471 RepID=UPI0023EBDE9B|nr:YheC/YheD family protein [Cohnella sp. YIM B05605]
MEQANGRQLADKWLKTRALLGHRQIAGHIPHTVPYNAGRLRGMTERHGMVVLKPVRGGGGYGLIRVAKVRRGYQLDYRAQKTVYRSFAAVRSRVNRIRRGRPYLIQKGIRLTQVNGRPIDYRVKYVKQDGVWRFRALVGRVARRGLFVTNLCQGGQMLTAAEGLRRSLSPRRVAAKKREMRVLTKLCTAVLERRFPGIGALGYDYGIDRKGQIWILEVNTRPQ